MDLHITVKEVKGHCPVYREGDSFRLADGYRLISEIPVCMHGLSALLPYYNALRFVSPELLDLAGKDKTQKAFVQCLDPYCYTGGGTVIFEISKSAGK